MKYNVSGITSSHKPPTLVGGILRRYDEELENFQRAEFADVKLQRPVPFSDIAVLYLDAVAFLDLVYVVSPENKYYLACLILEHALGNEISAELCVDFPGLPFLHYLRCNIHILAVYSQF